MPDRPASPVLASQPGVQDPASPLLARLISFGKALSMIDRVNLLPPFTPADDELLFFLPDAPIRKLRLLADAVGRVNSFPFHGHPAASMRLFRVNADPSPVTRRQRPTYNIWAFVGPIRSLPTPLKSFAIFGTVDFNTLPLGIRIGRQGNPI
jgi:hypothetical protein